MKRMSYFFTMLVLLLSCSIAQGAKINVGGVIWDPDQTGPLPNLADFVMDGTVIETVAFAVNDQVTGYGKVDAINSAVDNNFCPGCELTFTFSMDTVFISADRTSVEFDNFVIRYFVDHSPNYDATEMTAADGVLWLELVNHTGTKIVGTGTNIGTGSDTGTGVGLLDATDGLAFGNFDTNQEFDGADASFSSSFQPLDGTDLLSGTWELQADTIPSPGTIALFGLGLVGLGLSRRRKIH